MNPKELERRFKGLQEENVRLKEENAYLRFELQELKDKIYKKKPSKKDPPPSSLEQSVPKKRGGLLGHLGWFRKKPDRIDKIVEVKLDWCPSCGSGDLKECGAARLHLQEDIVPLKTEITCFRKHRYYCHSCKKVVQGRAEAELPHSHIGPLAKAAAAFFKYQAKISDRDILKIFGSLFGLKMTLSSIPGFRDQLGKRLKPLYENLKISLRRSKRAYVDETGWSVDGKKGWLWSASTRKVSVCHIDRSRGQAVVEKLLGTSFGGVLVSDFLSAYNKIPAKAKQRCLVHLKRELKRVGERLSEDASFQAFAARLEGLIDEAVELARLRKKRLIRKKNFAAKRKRLASALDDLKLHDPKHKILRRFSKRLERHKAELLTFLDYPGTAYHNNFAERQIRPNVLLRKVTFGNRSDRGAENHGILMSIVQTAKLNKADPLATLKNLLTATGLARQPANLALP